MEIEKFENSPEFDELLQCVKSLEKTELSSNQIQILYEKIKSFLNLIGDPLKSSQTTIGTKFTNMFVQLTTLLLSQNHFSNEIIRLNLKNIEKLIFNLNETNIQKTIPSIMELFDTKYPYSSSLLISKLLYSFYISKPNVNIVIDSLKELQTKNVEILNVFTEYLMRTKTQESNFILEKLLEHNLVKPSIVKYKDICYFAYLDTLKEFPQSSYPSDFISNINELSKDDWKLHKQLIHEAINPNEIAKILRNDNLEELQNISSQNNFNFNQKIKPSIYERFDMINKNNVSLIDFCAFFGSVKCFKYLLINGANVKSTLKYAIAGENVEIVHLCNQNESSFDNVLETAIEFHRNELFHYFYDKINQKNLQSLGTKCIQSYNFEIFSFLEEQGLQIDQEIINESKFSGNIFFVQYFKIKYTLHYNESSCIHYLMKSGNVELFDYLIDMGMKNAKREINIFNI